VRSPRRQVAMAETSRIGRLSVELPSLDAATIFSSSDFVAVSE